MLRKWDIVYEIILKLCDRKKFNPLINLSIVTNLLYHSLNRYNMRGDRYYIEFLVD